ncbi:MAG: methionyl-tRNA formyltransferase [Ruminococcus sp.]|nr:methionyl-tRNA formyltransferase [Ruminococcus sp.]
MKIVFMGTPDFAVTALDKLYQSEHEVLAVFTQPDKPKGRGYKLVPPPVKQFAITHDTPVFQPASLKKDADEVIEKLKSFTPDCIVVAAYGKILPKEVLDIPRLGCVNIHASLLPRYRGAAPIQRAILNGEKVTGITLMKMDEGLDTGDILLQKEIEIGENDTSSDMFVKLALLGADMLSELLPKLENGEITLKKQIKASASYAQMITKDMCPINFSDSVFKIHRQVCALSDSPCAYCFLNGKRLKVYRSEIALTDKVNAKVGEFVGEKNFDVACSDGVIRFVEIQAEGGKRMNAAAYLNGKPVEQGTVLE